MIDIIIPAYNAFKTINQTLLSVAMQDNIKNINVYIVNDGSDMNYNNQIDVFSKLMNIKELKIEKNSGPGFARQYGIDNSYSNYVMFIDSDDMLLDHNSVIKLYNVVVANDYDVVVSSFLEETDDGIVNHSNDTVFMHGKIYKRQFLIDNNIKFNNTYHNEDNGFNALILLHEPKICFLDEQTYLWKNNKDSITRRNNHEYAFNGLQGYIYNMEWAISLAIQHNCKSNLIADFCFITLLSVYYYYLEYKDDYLIKSLKKIYNYSLEYQVTKERKNEIFCAQFERSINDSNRISILNSIITFEQFIDRVISYDNGDVL